MSSTPVPPDPRRWRALGVCLVAAFMALLDVSIVNVALPSIQEGLDASPSTLQWILSGYVVAFGLVLVPAGRLGDALGRRLLFTLGVGGFTFASLLCGLADTAVLLALARILQGAAAGLIIPQNAGVIQELFRGPERGKAYGLLGAIIGLSTAIGPLAGGILIQVFGVEDGWRWVFLVNLPIGMVLIPIAWKLLPGRPEGRRRQGLDPVGTILLGVATVLVLLPLVEERQWEGAAKWLLVPAGLLVAAGFVLWERRHAGRGKDPLVDLRLFRLRSYSLGNVIGSVYFAGFTGVFFTYSLYLQQGEGYTALGAGLAQVPFAVGAGLSSWIGGRYVHRTGRSLVVAGLLVVAVSLAVSILVTSLVSGDTLGWALSLPFLVAGAGSGLVIAPNTTISLSEVPSYQAGSAAGVLQTGQRVGTAVGIALVGAVFFGQLAAGGADQWARAFEYGLSVCVALVAAALVVGVYDMVSHRRIERLAAPGV